MKVLDLFSGIGGFGLPAQRAGWEHLAFCEINQDCHKVLRRHFPGVEIITDVKNITKDRHSFQPDIICGGFPCQDLSVAGRRAGLAGERSGLWFEFIRIIADYKPRIVVIENVPGLLSSNSGRDLAVILRGLVECGYGVAWRVFDSQYFGVAQRRRRVFIVASLGSGRAAEILFEREGGGWNSAPSRETGEKVAAVLTAGTASGRGVNKPGRRREDDVNLVGCRMIAFGEYADDGTASTLKQRDYKDATDLIVQPNVTHTLRGEGFDGSEDGTGRGTPLVIVPEITGTIKGGSGRRGWESGAETADSLVAYAVQEDNQNGVCLRDIAGTLRSDAPGHQPCGTLAFTERTRGGGRNFEAQEELAYALTNPGSGGRAHSRQIAGQFGVRRLTPRECERLQGFPDDWTRYGDDGKEISDSARYRMIGNAITCNVGEWIFKRIQEFA